MLRPDDAGDGSVVMCDGDEGGVRDWGSFDAEDVERGVWDCGWDWDWDWDWGWSWGRGWGWDCAWEEEEGSKIGRIAPLLSRMPRIVFSLSLSSLLLASLLPPRPRPLKPIFINANNPTTRMSAGPLSRLKSQPMPPSTSLSGGRGRLFCSTKNFVRGDNGDNEDKLPPLPLLPPSASALKALKTETATTMKAGALVARAPPWRGEATNSHCAAARLERLSVATRGTSEPSATPGAAAPADPAAAVRLKAVSEQAGAAAAAAAVVVVESVFAVLGA